jgi:hypothetical protein
MLNIVYVGQLCDSGNYLVIFSSFFFAWSAISETDCDKP